MFLRLWIALGLATALLIAPGSSIAGEVIKIGTLAPKNSAWGRVLTVWEEAVKKRSGGALELQIFYNGQQGDDGAMVGKLKAGQLDGAAVSAIGLAQIHKPILALQIPGLFRTWDAIDRARAAVGPELQKGAEANGFYVSIGDIGRLRGMSRGFAVRRPADLRGKNVLAWRNDVIGPTVLQMIPGVSIVPLSAPEVLPALRTHTLDCLSAPTLAAEALQWTPHLDHISAETTVIAVGGMAWSKKRFDGLPGDLRQVLESTGKVAQDALKKRIRSEDDAAFDRLSKRMTVVTLTDAERNEWKDVFVKVGARLKQGTFDPELVDRLVAVAKQ